MATTRSLLTNLYTRTVLLNDVEGPSVTYYMRSPTELCVIYYVNELNKVVCDTRIFGKVPSMAIFLNVSSCPQCRRVFKLNVDEAWRMGTVRGS